MLPERRYRRRYNGDDDGGDDGDEDEKKDTRLRSRRLSRRYPARLVSPRYGETPTTPPQTTQLSTILSQVDAFVKNNLQTNKVWADETALYFHEHVFRDGDRTQTRPSNCAEKELVDNSKGAVDTSHHGHGGSTSIDVKQLAFWKWTGSHIEQRPLQTVRLAFTHVFECQCTAQTALSNDDGVLDLDALPATKAALMNAVNPRLLSSSGRVIIESVWVASAHNGLHIPLGIQLHSNTHPWDNCVAQCDSYDGGHSLAIAPQYSNTDMNKHLFVTGRCHCVDSHLWAPVDFTRLIRDDPNCERLVFPGQSRGKVVTKAVVVLHDSSQAETRLYYSPVQLLVTQELDRNPKEIILHGGGGGGGSDDTRDQAPDDKPTVATSPPPSDDDGDMNDIYEQQADRVRYAVMDMKLLDRLVKSKEEQIIRQVSLASVDDLKLRVWSPWRQQQQQQSGSRDNTDSLHLHSSVSINFDLVILFRSTNVASGEDPCVQQKQKQKQHRSRVRQ